MLAITPTSEEHPMSWNIITAAIGMASKVEARIRRGY